VHRAMKVLVISALAAAAVALPAGPALAQYGEAAPRQTTAERPSDRTGDAAVTLKNRHGTSEPLRNRHGA
jgi:hypothetical protein